MTVALERARPPQRPSSVSMASPRDAGPRAGSRRLAWAAWAAAGAAGAAWLAILGATPWGAAGEPVCLLRRVAHLSCPTCGLTRSLVLLARGDLAHSLALHPWGAALAIQLAAAWATWGLWIAGRLRRRPDRWLPHAVALNALALAALWLLRLVTGTLP